MHWVPAQARWASCSASAQAPRLIMIPMRWVSLSPGKPVSPVRAKQSSMASVHSLARR